MKLFKNAETHFLHYLYIFILIVYNSFDFIFKLNSALKYLNVHFKFKYILIIFIQSIRVYCTKLTALQSIMGD